MDEIFIKVGGSMSALIGIGHCFFYRGFGWAKDFEAMSMLTGKVLYTIHLFLIPVFFFFAYVSLAHAKELAGETSLGVAISAFYTLFWIARGIWQVAYFRPSRIENFGRLLPLHCFLIAAFAVSAAAYGLPLLRMLSAM